ncbi:RHS repeat domain-containing protein [Pleionea sp. CnH1-48]|uniref:RHS repeat domain-containing protein n=1 Tax=Pleionea sp. CnH1-48 TaxID=2954494 RepID=UPI002096D133|nr:hypothetical protein [Pleionea sp. CnH1-48]MCO7227521.1 hypothetical protein [Pleionea sp. CnH1-48]
MRKLIASLGVVLSSFAFSNSEPAKEAALTNVSGTFVTSNNSVEGEFLNFRDNTYYWEIRDIVMPTNGALDIELYRSHGKSVNTSMLPLENWDIEIPRIEIGTHTHGLTVGEYRGQGLCEDPRWGDMYNVDTSVYSFVHFNMIIPGQAPKPLLFKSSSAYPSDVKYITQDNWIVRCVNSNDPNGAKNTFEAVSPNGVTYTFNKIERMPYAGYLNSQRGSIRAYATEVKDVHNNSLTYSYDEVIYTPSQWSSGGNSNYKPIYRPYLKTITSSDGQSLSLKYENVSYKKRLISATANGKTWRYRYTDAQYENYPGFLQHNGHRYLIAPHLKEVETPIGQKSKYEYTLINNTDSWDYFGLSGFRNNHGSFAGATNWRGFFKLLKKATLPHGISVEYEYEECRAFRDNIEDPLIPCFPSVRNKTAYTGAVTPITRRTLSGRGITTPIVWDISRSPTQNEIPRLYQHTLNRTTIVTTYKTPSETTVNTYRGMFKEDEAIAWQEGALLRKEVYKPNDTGPLLAPYIEEYDYVKGPVIGVNRIDLGRVRNYIVGRNKAIEQRQLLSEKKVTIDGKVFKTTYPTYNDYGQPKIINEYGVNKNKTHNLSYEHKANIWRVGLLKTSSTVNGPSTTNTYNAKGQLEKSVKNGETELYEYHDNGELKYEKWYKDSVNDVQSIKYEDYYRGKHRKETRATGEILYSWINPDGTVDWQKDAKSNKVSYKYDDLYRHTKTDWPLYSDHNIKWNGWESKTESSGNERIQESFDAFGRVTVNKTWDISKPESAVYVRTEYDQDGEVTFKSFASFNSSETKGIQYEHDILGRVTKATDTSNNKSVQYFYGAEANAKLSGHPVSVNYGHLMIDSEGYYTVYNYEGSSPDSAKLVKVSKMERRPTDMGGLRYITTDIEWDNFGNIIKLTQGGITKSYEFYPDRPTLLKRSIQPEAITHFTYDLAGNIKTKRVEGKSATVYTYDNANRLTFIDYPDSDDIDIDYDSNGNHEKVTRGDTVWSYDYNTNNQMKSETLTIGSQSFKTVYEYNTDGKLEAIVYPSGRRVYMLPDALGNPLRLGNYATDIKYHPSGDAKSFIMGNGLSYEFKLNTDNLPKALELHKGSTMKAGMKFSFDDNRNLTGIYNQLRPHYNLSMKYDGLGRLTQANGTWGQGFISYDDVGNIKTKNIGSHQLTYHYNPKNQLQSISGARNATFSYDLQGNVKSNGINTYHYDDANELTDVTGQVSTAYVYDGNHKRAITYRDGAPIYNVYSNTGLLLHKFDSGKNEKTDYIYLNKRLIAKVEGEPSNVIAPAQVPSLTVPSTDADGAFAVTWGQSTGTDYYVLKERKNGGSWTLVYSGSALSQSLSGRGEGSYTYQVEACNAGGCSDVKVSNNLVVLFPPQAPTGLFAPTSDSDGTFAVRWNAVSGATSYELYEQKVGGTSTRIYSGASTTVQRNSLANGIYLYKVRACNSSGCGAFSIEKSVQVTTFGGGGGGCTGLLCL